MLHRLAYRKISNKVVNLAYLLILAYIVVKSRLIVKSRMLVKSHMAKKTNCPIFNRNSDSRILLSETARYSYRRRQNIDFSGLTLEI